MVAPNRHSVLYFRCRMPAVSRVSSKWRDRLARTDPFIVGLIRQLQREVKRERAACRIRATGAQTLSSEAPPPFGDSDLDSRDFDSRDFDSRDPDSRDTDGPDYDDAWWWDDERR